MLDSDDKHASRIANLPRVHIQQRLRLRPRISGVTLICLRLYVKICTDSLGESAGIGLASLEWLHTCIESISEKETTKDYYSNSALPSDKHHSQEWSSGLRSMSAMQIGIYEHSEKSPRGLRNSIC